ncbi:hypothetical protein Tco_1302064 [Tanacetum coccineum]
MTESPSLLPPRFPLNQYQLRRLHLIQEPMPLFKMAGTTVQQFHEDKGQSYSGTGVLDGQAGLDKSFQTMLAFHQTLRILILMKQDCDDNRMQKRSQWDNIPTMVLTLSHRGLTMCVKIWTTPECSTEGEWGDLLNEIMEVQTIFDQMDAAVQQSSVDKQCLEIAKKELLLENDRLLQQIMSQEVLLTVMNSMSLIVYKWNMDRKDKTIL